MITISGRFVKLKSFQYIAKLIFSEWFTGGEVNFEYSDYMGYSIIFEDNYQITIKSDFFCYVEKYGFTRQLVEKFQVNNVQLSQRDSILVGMDAIPLIYFSDKKNDNLKFLDFEIVNFDIFGMCFFLIARLDEFLHHSSDRFDRFEGTSSLAYRYGYLYYPLVDLYCKIFIGYINQTSKIKLADNTQFSQNVTCDVDNPFLFCRSRSNILKRAAADMLLRQDPESALKNMTGALLPRRFTRSMDPFSNGVDYIMSFNSKLSNSVRFNFIPLHTNNRYDGENNFASSSLKDLLSKILRYGHQIGIHPGFETYKSSKNMNASVQRYKEVLGEVGDSNFVSGRQHYLRWKTGVTEALLSNAGVNEDSSLSYADTGGFRCSTTKPFFLYDLVNDSVTKTREIPLIVMETTYFGQGYLNLNNDEIFDKMNEMKRWCKVVNGTFTILWHNCGLQTKIRREIYEQILTS